jgi:hypothetical protein
VYRPLNGILATLHSPHRHNPAAGNRSYSTPSRQEFTGKTSALTQSSCVRTLHSSLLDLQKIKPEDQKQPSIPQGRCSACPKPKRCPGPGRAPISTFPGYNWRKSIWQARRRRRPSNSPPGSWSGRRPRCLLPGREEDQYRDRGWSGGQSLSAVSGIARFTRVEPRPGYAGVSRPEILKLADCPGAAYALNQRREKTGRAHSGGAGSPNMNIQTSQRHGVIGTGPGPSRPSIRHQAILPWQCLAKITDGLLRLFSLSARSWTDAPGEPGPCRSPAGLLSAAMAEGGIPGDGISRWKARLKFKA